MAVKTLIELIGEVKNLVDDASLPDAWITAWLNEGLVSLAPVLRLEGRSTAGVAAGISEYALPVDCYKVRMMKLASETSSRTLVQPSDFTSTGYKLWGKTIIFQPAIGQEDTMELWYWRVPKALGTVSDRPEVPEPFQHLLVWYAGGMFQAYQRDVELENTVFYRRFLEGKAALDKYTAARTGGGIREVGVVR